MYQDRSEAIQRLIIEPIEGSGEVKDARAEYDIDAIADKVLGRYARGYALRWAYVEESHGSGRFWKVVVDNGRTTTADDKTQGSAE